MGTLPIPQNMTLSYARLLCATPESDEYREKPQIYFMILLLLLDWYMYCPTICPGYHNTSTIANTYQGRVVYFNHLEVAEIETED